MKNSAHLHFEKIEEADISELTAIMVRAFEDSSQRFQGKPMERPPGYETGEWLRNWMNKGVTYKIVKNGETIGGFIVILNFPKPSYNYLASIFIDPTLQNQAVGTKTLQFIERTFPTQIWQTMTEAWAIRNHHFYEKNGYTKVKEVYDEKAGHKTYVYEKALR